MLPSDHILTSIFIIDLDTHGTTEDSSSGLLQFGEPSPPTPPPDPKPPSPHSSPSPPRQRPRYLPRAPLGQRSRGRGQRRGLGRGQMFEDPAVMRIVQGRPSLKVMEDLFTVRNLRFCLNAACPWSIILLFKGLDSAIVDCGNAMYWNTYEGDVSTHFEKAVFVPFLCTWMFPLCL